MAPPYEKHLFVCTNRRPDGHPKGCCASKGADEVRASLKAELGRQSPGRSVRVNAAGCLDACEHGVAVVVYPDGVWYGGVTAADARAIVEEHLLGGRPVERLRLPLHRP